MRLWGWLLVLASCGSGGLTLDEYPAAAGDAYCKYLTRCGAFSDVTTCERADIGIEFTLDPTTKAEVDMGKVIFDGQLAQDCLDAFGAQSCDKTDEDGRGFVPVKCRDIAKGTVGNGGACAENAECKSKVCNVPTCNMACCQGTCTGDSEAPLGGSGAMCTSSSACAVGFYCDFTNQVCAELKPAGAACNATDECSYGLGCAGTTMRTCKALPTLGQACPDGTCRDFGTYCNSAGQCAKIGLAGAACSGIQGECSAYYPCSMATMQCTAAPGLGEACTSGCFPEDAFCDTSSPTPTCVNRRPDGGACTSSSQCENNYCDTGSGGGSGTCGEKPVCI